MNPKRTHADIHWMLEHANMTDEELDELRPFDYDNRPTIMLTERFVQWTHNWTDSSGPHHRKTEGRQVTFEDGSRYRIAYHWEVGEVLPPVSNDN